MTIRNAAVVGAGTMGSGIAQKLATEGNTVVLLDRTQALAHEGHAKIARMLDEAVARRVFARDRADAILARITPSDSLEMAAAADAVIEAVFEDLNIKRQLFCELDRLCPASTLLATNTSSFQVAELTQDLTHPERVLGLHFFFHPAKNRLVEVIGHAGTSPDLLELAWRWQEATGKTPIASRDAPGFVVNRYFVPWLNEAVRLHEEGLDIATIEAVAKQTFGVSMGPFELMNVTGVAIALHAATTLGQRLGRFYEPASMLARQVQLATTWDLAGHADAAAARDVGERLWGAVLSAAMELVSDGVSTPGDVDLGARVGLRWPLGPFEHANRLGLAATDKLIEATRVRYGQSPAVEVLQQQRAVQRTFSLDKVRLDIRNGIARIRLNRPDKLNALDPESVEELEERFDDAAARNDVHGIVISGVGKAFVAGADVKFFVDAIERRDLDAIEAFSAQGQRLFRRIETCHKPVVGVLTGMALGGGAELALACHGRIATEKATMAFPETALGIYPGLGGTQRLTRHLGRGLARYLICTGRRLDAKALYQLGLVDEVVTPEDLEAAVARRLSADTTTTRPREVPEEISRPAKYLEQISVTQLAGGDLTLPGGDEIRELVRKLRQQAPLALAAVERLTSLAVATDLDDGLAAESAGIRDIFSTEDALEGMRALLEGRRAHFVGR